MNQKAQVVANYIRKTVKRPEPPVFGKTLRFRDGRCPMGLLKEAYHVVPSKLGHFVTLPESIGYDEIVAFANWWDNQIDPVFALEAV